MKMRSWLVAALSLLAASSVSVAAEVVGLPLHIERLNPKAVRVWLGDHVSSTAVVAIATEKGIVVVDTVGIPKVDVELRRIIARELGRDDFATLINTHEHGDHTWGNAVYADCDIVTHTLCAEGMRARSEDRQQTLGVYATHIAQMEAELAKQPAGSPEAKKLHEDLVVWRLNQEVLRANEAPRVPTVTFSERMTMDMGDATFELYYVGGMHSASDIAVFVPELGLLMTGDTMADIWLTDTPGCLASFAARPGVPHDFPLLLENWEILLAKKDTIKDLIPGHWNGDLTFAGFQARHDYVKTLWEGVNRAAGEGKELVSLFAEYDLATRFPALAASPGFSPRNNASTLVEMWSCASGQDSAAAKLYALIDEGAPEEAIRKVIAARSDAKPKYFFLEAEINGYGYRFMGQEKAAQAVAMFKANVELFPESWNAHDSLGEALLKAGETQAAIAAYEKSVVLNPNNTNGKDALSRIRSSAPGQ